LDAIPLGPGSNERLNLDDSITASFTLLAVGRNLRLGLNSDNFDPSLQPNHATSASTYLAHNDLNPLGPGGMLAGGLAMGANSIRACFRETELVQVPINQPTASEIFTKLPNHLYSRIRAGIEMESQGRIYCIPTPVVLMQALLPFIKYVMEDVASENKTTVAATIAVLSACVHMVRVDNWASLRRSGELTGDQLRAMQATEITWAEGGNYVHSKVGNFRAERLGGDAKVSDALLAADHAGSGIDRAALYRTICAIGTTATAFLCVDQARTTGSEQSLAGNAKDSIHQLVNGQVPWPTAAMQAGFGLAIGMACVFIANHLIKDPIARPALPAAAATASTTTSENKQGSSTAPAQPAAPAQNAETGAGHAQIFTTRTVAGFAAGAFAGGGLGVGGLIGAALAVSLGTVGPNRREVGVGVGVGVGVAAPAEAGQTVENPQLEIVVDNDFVLANFGNSNNLTFELGATTNNSFTTQSSQETKKNNDRSLSLSPSLPPPPPSLSGSPSSSLHPIPGPPSSPPPPDTTPSNTSLVANQFLSSPLKTPVQPKPGTHITFTNPSTSRQSRTSEGKTPKKLDMTPIGSPTPSPAKGQISPSKKSPRPKNN
jgi:hypothetical protein